MKPSLKYAAFAVFAVALFATGHWGTTMAQHSTNSVHNSSHANSPVENIPLEGGQSAFAAVAEIVAILENDPTTDWSTVDIKRLRDHLVDMNSLMLRAKVEARAIPNGAEFTITGSELTLRAIQSMVPAHAIEITKMSIWDARTEQIPEGARLTVTSVDKAVVAKIFGLGFFGLMATGAHHQPHHLGMAKGTMSH